MEFVNGGDLYSLLQNVGYLEEDVTCLYVAEIGLALHYLHSTLGVVHRDIKPENVLIHQVCIEDFMLHVCRAAPALAAARESSPRFTFHKIRTHVLPSLRNTHPTHPTPRPLPLLRMATSS